MQQSSSSQEALARKLLALLTEYPDHFFTVKELIEDRHFYNTRQQIQTSLDRLLREGQIRVMIKGKEAGYQAIAVQQKKKTSPMP